MFQNITSVGGRLQFLRKRRGLTQEGLAEQMKDFSRAQIASYESGKNQPPWPFIIQFVRICNSSYEEVLDGKPAPTKPAAPANTPDIHSDDLLNFINGLPLEEGDKNRLLTDVGNLYRKLNEQKDKIMEILMKRLNL